MSRALTDRADAELANVRAHARALRAQLRDANPLLWLGGGALAGALAARIAGARRGGTSPAPIALLAGLAEGYALRALKPFLAHGDDVDEPAP